MKIWMGARQGGVCVIQSEEIQLFISSSVVFAGEQQLVTMNL